MSAAAEANRGSGRAALVTGGAGFIGSHIVRGLLEQGWSVRVLDDLSTGTEHNLEEVRDHIDFISGDIRDEACVKRAVNGVELVFHQAALPSVPKSVAMPVETNAINIGGTLQVLDAARHAGVRRLVFAASSSAYGDTEVLPKSETLPASPQSPYALQKYAGEVYCELFFRLYGLETVALRYFNIFGPRQDPTSDYAAVIPSFVDAALSGKAPTIYGDGEQTRDFTYVGNVVRANLQAAHAPDAPGHVINIAAGQRTSLNGLWAQIQQVVGTQLEPNYETVRAGDVRDSLADLARARHLLGYEPVVDLPEGLKRTVESMTSAA